MEEHYEIDVIDYDYENDSLIFNSKSREYESSIDLGDIILDIGVDGMPVGAEMLHASKLFNVPKSALMDFVKFKAEILISEEEIEVKFAVTVLMRNMITEKVAFSHGVNDINIPAAQVAMAC
jgi:uncharacterized protein YuzE